MSNDKKFLFLVKKKTMKMFNQGTSKPEASHSENGDDIGAGLGAWACEELVELDDLQLATVVGGGNLPVVGGFGWNFDDVLVGGFLRLPFPTDGLKAPILKITQQ